MKPEFILLDIHMPVLNGFQTMLILRDSFPDIHVVILSMEDLESSVIQYLNLGAKGYLLKGMSSPEVIINCFDKILETGSSFPSFVTQEMLSTRNIEVLSKKWELTDRQMEFLKLTTQTAMTYKEIADVMCLSIKTIENYQAALFKQFDVKSRPGLMLFVQEHSLFSFKKH